MKCNDVENMLIFYLEDDLNARDTSLIEKHLDHCGKCRRLFYELKATLSVMEDEKTYKPDPLAYSRIMARLELGTHSKKQIKHIVMPRFVRVAAVILLLLLAGFMGVLLGSKYVSNNLLAQEPDPYEYYAQEFYVDNYADKSIEYYIMNQNEYEDEDGK